MTIYLLTNLSTGERLAYTQIGAFLAHSGNPISVSPRQWSNIVRDNKKETGKKYPVVKSGWEVDKLVAKTGKEIRELEKGIY